MSIKIKIGIYEGLMKKIISLKLNKEFKRAYYQGKFKAHPLLVTYMVKNKGKYPAAKCKEPRIGITTSKKIGCAVERNRAKRIIKQAFVELQKEGIFNLSGFDFVFVARSDTVLSKTKKIKAVMKKQIELLNKQIEMQGKK